MSAQLHGCAHSFECASTSVLCHIAGWSSSCVVGREKHINRGTYRTFPTTSFGVARFSPSHSQHNNARNAHRSNPFLTLCESCVFVRRHAESVCRLLGMATRSSTLLCDDAARRLSVPPARCVPPSPSGDRLSPSQTASQATLADGGVISVLVVIPRQLSANPPRMAFAAVASHGSVVTWSA